MKKDFKFFLFLKFGNPIISLRGIQMLPIESLNNEGHWNMQKVSQGKTEMLGRWKAKQDANTHAKLRRKRVRKKNKIQMAVVLLQLFRKSYFST